MYLTKYWVGTLHTQRKQFTQVTLQYSVFVVIPCGFLSTQKQGKIVMLLKAFNIFIITLKLLLNM